MTLHVCLFAESKLFLCRETQSLVHSYVHPSTIARCPQTQSQESLLTTTTPLALTTDSLNHEDPRVSGGPDRVLGGGRRAVRWRRL